MQVASGGIVVCNIEVGVPEKVWVARNGTPGTGSSGGRGGEAEIVRRPGWQRIWPVDLVHWCKAGTDELNRQAGPCTGGLKGRITGSRVAGEKVVGGTDWYTGN